MYKIVKSGCWVPPFLAAVNIKGGENMVEGSESSAEIRRQKRLANLKPGYKPPKKQIELMTHCRNLTMECADVLTEIMRTTKNKAADRIKAAEIILGYGWGKPKQQTELTGKDNGPLLFIWDDKNE